MQMTTITFRLPINTKKQLESIANEKKRKYTKLTRQIVENYVENYNI